MQICITRPCAYTGATTDEGELEFGCFLMDSEAGQAFVHYERGMFTPS